MKIVVAVKQVPDPDALAQGLAVDPGTAEVLIPPQSRPVVSRYDGYALELALRMKGAAKAEVIALGLGPAGAAEALRRALAMGADVAVRIDAPAGDLDSWQTATMLAAAIRRLDGDGDRVDLVLCGRQASDTDAGQVPAGIAVVLDVPFVVPVQAAEWRDGHLIVERLTEDGHQVLAVELPAVLGVSSESGEPRLPSMRGVIAAGRAGVATWTPMELGLAAIAPRLRRRSTSLDTPARECELIAEPSAAESGRRLADRLREAGLI